MWENKSVLCTKQVCLSDFCLLQVQNTANGTVETVAFASVPQGQNTSTYTTLGLQLLLTNCTTYPLNETYQAALLNSMHLAFDDVHVPHILHYQSQAVGSILPHSIQFNKKFSIVIDFGLDCIVF